ncbi:deleted in malignant brain tumors 1 protein-like, partial [Ruditapes philippinarum]|uniref:deleted in malignant brain tumors 1 protein-like n=1 Tax=Ruditapes philippinarum TaxID=129788 RepID=UPI00295AA47E
MKDDITMMALTDETYVVNNGSELKRRSESKLQALYKSVLVVEKVRGTCEASGEKLNVNGIRLVNGTQPYSGRVEININGVWGTVCDDSFDFNDANVMCRMIGLKATTFESSAFYGPGIGPIFAQEFKCNGIESHIKDCEFVPNVECTHDRDISIFCTECGKLEIRNGKTQSISADGRNIVISCIDGYSSNITTSICESGSWLYRIFYTSSNVYGSGTGPIHIDNLNCEGDETNIDECKYSQDVSCTDHNRDAAVACNRFRIPYMYVLSKTFILEWPMTLVTNTRLVNGTGPYDGRMEMFVNGQWGTIDARYVDMYDARTICNAHNASLAMYFTSAIYGQGTGPILSRELYCNGERSHISSCSGHSPYGSSASHTYDLSIACTKHPLQIEDIALHGGRRPTEGRVDLKVNETWGTICDTGFDSADARVICRMFGLQYKSFFPKASHYSKKGSGPIYISNMKCNGTESHINECSYEISNQCTHYDDVAVECTGYHLNITGVRLAGTNGPYHGRVEIKVNETWGT